MARKSKTAVLQEKARETLAPPPVPFTHLSLELLDDAIREITAILGTVEASVTKRARESLTDCLKQLDRLYPYVWRHDAQASPRPAEAGPGPGPGTETPAD